MHIRLTLALTITLVTAGPASPVRAQERESLRPTPQQFTQLKRDAEKAFLQNEPKLALTLAAQARRAMPDDLEIYSILVRAHLALGQIPEAEKQAQWMLDLRTEHPLSLQRAADVREAIGQFDGAIALLNDAFGRVRTPQEKAAILTQAARLQRKAGREASAQRLIEEAYKLMPQEPKP
ncbi:MAG: hypothetical protein IPJ98_01990 [Bryobacterales bacterium]|nr:hypothetical protein [Bryobacterales bacterium]